MESVIRNAASQIAQVGIWKSLEGNVFSSQKLAAVRSVFELATKPVSPVTLINSPLPLALEIAIQIYPLFLALTLF
jgi:hypothetical protein